jgi:fimbrial chaperone protein
MPLLHRSLQVARLVVRSLGALCFAVPAACGTFSASPTRVQLSEREPSATITLQNDGDESARFQLSAFAWEQDSDGQPSYLPTEDVVAFPPLLTLEPGAKRAIRVGMTTRSSAREKAYRIFLEELPPPPDPDRRPEAQQVRVLTRLGLPVFVAPTRPAGAQRVELGAMVSGHLTLAVWNDGNVHLHPWKVMVVALDGSGSRVFERELPGGYILAGQPRTFTVDLTGADCSRIAAFDVQLANESAQTSQRLAVPAGACAPR